MNDCKQQKRKVKYSVKICHECPYYNVIRDFGDIGVIIFKDYCDNINEIIEDTCFAISKKCRFDKGNIEYVTDTCFNCPYYKDNHNKHGNCKDYGYYCTKYKFVIETRVEWEIDPRCEFEVICDEL